MVVTIVAATKKMTSNGIRINSNNNTLPIVMVENVIVIITVIITIIIQ